MDKNDVKENFITTVNKLQNSISEFGNVSRNDICMFNPLVLAYVGDAVYELFVRTLLISSGGMQVSKLHKRSIYYVKAKSQAEILSGIEGELTAEEADIVRRGRNTKSATIPKNAEVSDYRYATGFEALLGYLYLTGAIDRLMELLTKVVEVRK